MLKNNRLVCLLLLLLRPSIYLPYFFGKIVGCAGQNFLYTRAVEKIKTNIRHVQIGELPRTLIGTVNYLEENKVKTVNYFHLIFNKKTPPKWPPKPLLETKYMLV